MSKRTIRASVIDSIAANLKLAIDHTKAAMVNSGDPALPGVLNGLQRMVDTYHTDRLAFVRLMFGADRDYEIVEETLQ